MSEPKYDSETLAQLATIAAKNAADKNAKELESLKTQLAQVVKLCGELSKNTEERLKALERAAQGMELSEKELAAWQKIKDEYKAERAEEAKKTPRWLESLINLFKK